MVQLVSYWAWLGPGPFYRLSTQMTSHISSNRTPQLALWNIWSLFGATFALCHLMDPNGLKRKKSGNGTESLTSTRYPQCIVKLLSQRFQKLTFWHFWNSWGRQFWSAKSHDVIQKCLSTETSLQLNWFRGDLNVSSSQLLPCEALKWTKEINMMLAEDEEKTRDDRSNDFLNPVGNARNAIAKLTGQTLFMQKRLAFGWSWGMDVSNNQKLFPVFRVSSETCHLKNPNVRIIVGCLLTRKSEQADTDDEDNGAYKRMSLGKLFGWMPTVPLLQVDTC